MKVKLLIDACCVFYIDWRRSIFYKKAESTMLKLYLEITKNRS